MFWSMSCLRVATRKRIIGLEKAATRLCAMTLTSTPTGFSTIHGTLYVFASFSTIFASYAAFATWKVRIFHA